jgi:hypothetical protein
MVAQICPTLRGWYIRSLMKEDPRGRNEKRGRVRKKKKKKKKSCEEGKKKYKRRGRRKDINMNLCM